MVGMEAWARPADVRVVNRMGAFIFAFSIF